MKDKDKALIFILGYKLLKLKDENEALQKSLREYEKNKEPLPLP